MCSLSDEAIDVAGICETWLSEDTSPITASIKSHGYTILHDFRRNQRGGGTAVIFKSCYNVKRLTINATYKTFEFTAVTVHTQSNKKLSIIVMYRTGPISQAFLQELDSLLAIVFSKSDYFMLTGDLNIHFELQNNKKVKDCVGILMSYGLMQHVETATHHDGGYLDQIWSFSLDNSLTCNDVVVDTDNTLGSDHYPVYCNIGIELKGKYFKELTYRNIKNIDAEFTTDLEDVLAYHSNPSSTYIFGDYVRNLNSSVSEVLDKHAPVITKQITIVDKAPWFDKEYRNLRKLRRRAERKLRKSRKLIDKLQFKQLCKEATTLAIMKKREHFSKCIVNDNNNPRTLYQLVNKELDRKQSNPIPDFTEDISELASTFNTFFTDKIEKIRSSLGNEPSPKLDEFRSNQYLDSLEPATEDEIRAILKDSGIKCSPSDLLPQKLLQENLDRLMPTILNLVNMSLREGSMDGVKLADIIPLIKDTSLDINILKNYRPVSNLTFLGKLIERVVLKRLEKHLSDNGLTIPEQSAYKRNNSTETLLIRLSNDILVASDSKSATVVMLLDLSAAFDTVDHSLLLKILKTEIGLRGTALRWFSSFLTGRSQRIRINSNLSEDLLIRFGVPQGSVLGPVLFNIYIRSIYGYVKNLGFDIYGYADDHQIIRSFSPLVQNSVLSIDLSQCFKQIKVWMDQFFLQLNADKTQIIVFGPSTVLSDIRIYGTNLAPGIAVRFVNTVKNLGILMDSSLTMKQQVINMKKKCFTTLRNICKIRFLLSKHQLKMIVNSLVVSGLDYCNGLYYGINQELLHQLQLIQNSACKAITGKYKHDHLEDDFKHLHWLNIQKRILFKIALLTFKAINGLAPPYLQDLINYEHHGHALKLIVPTTSTRMGARAFSVIGPKLFNSIPNWVKQTNNIEHFKKSLKTFLFNCDVMQLGL